MAKGMQYQDSSGIGETFPQIARGREMLYITRRQIEDMGYSGQEILELSRLALAEHGKKQFEMPAKIGIHPIADTFHHAMPAYVPAARASGLKWVACFPENYKYGLDQTSALIVLNDIQTGFPLAVMDGAWITAKRTAAVSALAAEKLARKNTSEIGILGCGTQGREHVMALALTLPNLKKVKVRDLRPGVAAQMINEFKGKYRFEIVEAGSVEELVRGSDVVVSATSILLQPKPFVRDAWIKAGALLLPVDFDSVFEWETMQRADKFLVDSLDEMKYFMSMGYLAHGLPPLYAEIGEVVAGVKPGRQNDKELIFDMNIGMGVLDVVLAQDVVKRALKQNFGTRLPL